MTNLELTKLWLTGYHEQAISHGLTQSVFHHQLSKLDYSTPEINRLLDQLSDEIEQKSIPTEITVKSMTGGKKVLRGQEAINFYHQAKVVREREKDNSGFTDVDDVNWETL